MESKINVKIIDGSTRQGRFSNKPATWLYNELKKESEINVELLDLRDYPMQFFNDPISPSIHEGKYSDPVVQKWSEKINEADAFVIVTPEYNHGYPAVLKNALDVLYKEWNNKPVGFVSYGSVMGARAIEQLRLVAIELQMAPIRTSIHIPGDIYTNANSKGEDVNLSAFEPLRKGPTGDRVAIFISQLLWWARALKAARDNRSSI